MGEYQSRLGGGGGTCTSASTSPYLGTYNLYTHTDIHTHAWGNNILQVCLRVCKHTREKNTVDKRTLQQPLLLLLLLLFSAIAVVGMSERNRVFTCQCVCVGVCVRARTVYAVQT